MGATLASLPTPAVWAHFFSGESGGLEQAQLQQQPSSDAFYHSASPPALPNHWEAHEMDYSTNQYMMAPPPGSHISSQGPRGHHNPSTVQWTVSGESHHSNVMQQHHSSNFPETIAPAPRQDRSHVHHNAPVNLLNEATDEIRDAKRPASLSNLGSGEEMSSSDLFTKRPRLEQTASCVPFKVRKEKLGERITALQQLVSPFGKTDTASVLLEAIGYIKFLQDQVQVLSTPYMKPHVIPGNVHRGRSIDFSDSQELGGNNLSWPGSKAKNAEDVRQDLRSRGLCLVPVSCTLQVANDNGADFWTPAIGGSCR